MVMQSAIELLSQLDLWSFVHLFWFYVIFDLSRYLLGVLSVLLAAPWNRNEDSGTRSDPVSVLLVGFNEAAALRRSVRSLHEQTHERLELILVDDGSVDDMRATGLELKKQGLIDKVISSGIRGGKSSGINLGIRYASHELISIVDIDTSFDRDAFEHLIAPMSDEQTGAVSGNLGVRNSNTRLMARFQCIEYLTSISIGRRFVSALGILSIVSGAFGVFRRSALEQVGGWDVGPGEDADITDKLRRAGWKICFAPHAWSMTDVPETLLGFTRQRLRWNRSVIRFRMRKYRGAFNPFSANFSFANMIAMSNILFYQVALSVSFYIYISWLFWTLGSSGALLILGATMIIYVTQGLLVYLVAHLLYGSRAPLRYMWYVPGHTLFSTFVQRGIRMLAYLDELVFRRSFHDPYVPTKVRSATEQF
jgi:cellulose synthase/poly-beta-1,6-N-acetylglucosamine synthase-like glycosyltransferase